MSKFSVNTPQLLNNILLSEYGNKSEIQIPVKVFAGLLDAVTERCSELNDPKLNALMCRLQLYAIADPNNEHYDPKAVKAVMQRENDSLTLIERYKQLHGEIQAFLGFSVENAPIDESLLEGSKWFIEEKELFVLKGKDEYRFDISFFNHSENENPNLEVKRGDKFVYVCCYQENWRETMTKVLYLENEVSEDEYMKLLGL